MVYRWQNLTTFKRSSSLSSPLPSSTSLLFFFWCLNFMCKIVHSPTSQSFAIRFQLKSKSEFFSTTTIFWHTFFSEWCVFVYLFTAVVVVVVCRQWCWNLKRKCRTEICIAKSHSESNDELVCVFGVVFFFRCRRLLLGTLNYTSVLFNRHYYSKMNNELVHFLSIHHSGRSVLLCVMMNGNISSALNLKHPIHRVLIWFECVLNHLSRCLLMIQWLMKTAQHYKNLTTKLHVFRKNGTHILGDIPKTYLIFE